MAGLAPDGGLYLPETLHRLPWSVVPETLAQTSMALLAPMFAHDALAQALPNICEQALTVPVPLRSMQTPNDYILELFHGPTLAFKDFGARFLAVALDHLHVAATRPLTILVATSGDTGAAVAAACDRRPGLRVVILYPEGRVSARQAHQLGCWGDNVYTLCVSGAFDDCQALVKQALNDSHLQAEVPMTSANSISLGRLLPQLGYYGHVALSHYAQHQRTLNFVVPTGNLGNALAAIMARQSGAPIGEIVLATNANRVLVDFFSGQFYQPRPSVQTLANAMDVGAPSNFERLRYLYHGNDQALRRNLRAFRVDDALIATTIRQRYQRYGEIVCPHTATAVATLEQLRAQGHSGDWAVVATAHPAKFDTVVEPLIGTTVALPDSLADLLQRSASAEPIAPDLAVFRHWLRQFAQ